ncbi:MAG TPA: PIG-L family deacetylase [Roseiflexaceae bacterium]|nr:PIG-L family deacetylase [Roseiflexaceae bacterium]
MRVEDLRQIHDSYDHIYLSPHLDDAALSCGGSIAAHLAQDARVLVVTLCTASPPPEGPFNAVAQEFHADWGLEAADVMAVRLGEELLAMERLGPDFFWAGMLDAIYRVPHAYTSRETLFSTPVPDDPLHAELRQLLAALRARAPHATLYAPLGVGDHVDHLVAYDAALATAGPALAFYEDVHYVLQPGALERRLAAVREPLAPSLIDISAVLERKIHAIAAYGSQVPELFGGEAQMASQITAYARSLASDGGGYFERVWRLSESVKRGV